MQRSRWQKIFDELTTNNSSGHRRNVVPEPLLVDECATFFKALAILHQDRSTQRTGNRHRIGGQHQSKNQPVGHGELAHQQEPAGGGGTRNQKVAFAAVTEEQNEIGDEAVKWLYYPRQIKQGEVGGDLQGCPTLHLF